MQGYKVAGSVLTSVFGLQVPVCQGALKSLKGVAKERIADFVHGSDGFGNTGQPAPKVGINQLPHRLVKCLAPSRLHPACHPACAAAGARLYCSSVGVSLRTMGVSSLNTDSVSSVVSKHAAVPHLESEQQIRPC